MTTSREMLQYAAKAAGAEWTDYSDGTTDHWKIEHPDGVWRKWEPENSDIDAVRLAASLGMRVDFSCAIVCDSPHAVGVWIKGDASHLPPFWQATYPDMMRNARMTILRAAAHVGKLMENKP